MFKLKPSYTISIGYPQCWHKELQPLTLEDGLSLLLFSAVLGWFGAWLSVNQHLTQLDLR